MNLSECSFYVICICFILKLLQYSIIYEDRLFWFINGRLPRAHMDTKRSNKYVHLILFIGFAILFCIVGTGFIYALNIIWKHYNLW